MYDLIVVGAGGAGSTAAAEAIGRGARVALIEQWLVGGTCLNAGCDPTKTLIRSAEVMHLARQAAGFGITVGSPVVDWPAVRHRVATVIDTIRGGDGDQNIRDSGVALYKGHANFLSSHEIEINDETLAGEKIIIATGSTTRVPPVLGLAGAGYITNIEAVDLLALPHSLAIIGGGIVAVEFAQLFSRFGVEVTIVGARGQLLPGDEPEIAAELRQVLKEEGIRIETGVRVTRAERRDSLKWISGQRGDVLVEIGAEEILVAAGRIPVVAGMNLDVTGVVYGEAGIAVDAELRTNVPHIWAIGDVTGLYPFTHIADYQARLAEHNAMSGAPPRQANYRVVPRVTFSDPEAARVGLTDAEAREAGFATASATVNVRDLARAQTSGETAGLVKLVAEAATGRLLGGHILSAHAGDLIAELALAIRANLTVMAIADTIHPYPTFSEGIFWAAYELAKRFSPGDAQTPAHAVAPMVLPPLP